MLFQISGAAKHSVQLYCAHSGCDYISLSMHIVFCSLFRVINLIKDDLFFLNLSIK